MDLAGLVIGLTGPLEQTIRLLQTIKRNHHDQKRIDEKCQGLIARCEELFVAVTTLKRCSSTTWPDKHFQASFERRLRRMEEGLNTAQVKLCALIGERQQLRKDDKASRDKLRTIALKTSQYVSGTSVIRALKELEQTLEKHQDAENGLFMMVHMSREISSVTAVHSIVYRPHFDEAGVPDELVLDYQSGRGDDETVEAMVKKAILADSTRIVGIKGMGGVGKSSLLRALTHEPDIKQRFSAGVFFITIGQQQTKAGVIQEVSRLVNLTGNRELASEILQVQVVLAACQNAAKWFTGKQVLFLLDDVWSTAGRDCGYLEDLIQMVPQGQPSACMAFTTREGRVLRKADSNGQIEMEARDALGRQARSMLCRYANFRVEDVRNSEHAGDMDSILRYMNGLPLSLSIAGRSIAAKASKLLPKERLKAWKIYARLITGGSATILRDTDDHPGLAFAIESSLRHLDKGGNSTPRQRFLALSVLQKQDVAPQSMLACLWDMPDMGEVDAFMFALGDSSLVSVVYLGEDEFGLRVHDLVLDHCKYKAIQEQTYHGFHVSLVESYVSKYNLRSPDGGTRWWRDDLEDDNYIQSRLARHLVEAKYVKQLRALLLDVRWTWKQLETGGTLKIGNDFQALLDCLPEGHEDDAKAFKYIRAAIYTSARYLQKDRRNSTYEFFGRLCDVENSNHIVYTFLESVRRYCPKPFIIPSKAIYLLPIEGLRRFMSVPRSIHSMLRLPNSYHSLIVGEHFVANFDLVTGITTTVIAKDEIPPRIIFDSGLPRILAGPQIWSSTLSANSKKIIVLTHEDWVGPADFLEPVEGHVSRRRKENYSQGDLYYVELRVEVWSLETGLMETVSSPYVGRRCHVAHWILSPHGSLLAVLSEVEGELVIEVSEMDGSPTVRNTMPDLALMKSIPARIGVSPVMWWMCENEILMTLTSKRDNAESFLMQVWNASDLSIIDAEQLNFVPQEMVVLDTNRCVLFGCDLQRDDVLKAEIWQIKPALRKISSRYFEFEQKFIFMTAIASADGKRIYAALHQNCNLKHRGNVRVICLTAQSLEFAGQIEMDRVNYFGFRLMEAAKDELVVAYRTADRSGEAHVCTSFALIDSQEWSHARSRASSIKSLYQAIAVPDTLAPSMLLSCERYSRTRRELHLWNLKSGKLVDTCDINLPSNAVQVNDYRLCVQFSSCGKYLAFTWTRPGRDSDLLQIYTFREDACFNRELPNLPTLPARVWRLQRTSKRIDEASRRTGLVYIVDPETPRSETKNGECESFEMEHSWNDAICLIGTRSSASGPIHGAVLHLPQSMPFEVAMNSDATIAAVSVRYEYPLIHYPLIDIFDVPSRQRMKTFAMCLAPSVEYLHYIMSDDVILSMLGRLKIDSGHAGMLAKPWIVQPSNLERSGVSCPFTNEEMYRTQLNKCINVPWHHLPEYLFFDFRQRTIYCRDGDDQLAIFKLYE